MPIDWDAQTTAAAERKRLEAEEHQRELQEHEEQQRKAEEDRRAVYLGDAERIERDQPRAIQLALKLLEKLPEEQHQEVKDAAELADLETLEGFEWETLSRRERDTRKLLMKASRRTEEEEQMIRSRVADFESRAHRQETRRQEIRRALGYC